MRRRQLGFIATVLTAGWALSVPAAGTKAVPLERLEACGKERRTRARVACYDALLAEYSTVPAPADRTAAAARPAPAEGEIATTDSGANTATAALPGPQPTSQAQAPGSATDTNGSAFGAEQLEVNRKKVAAQAEIRSRLLGEFAGWKGNTVFRLANGQVWRQAEPGRISFRAVEPMITIRRGSFGTYRLSVEGVRRQVRVKRVE